MKPHQIGLALGLALGALLTIMAAPPASASSSITCWTRACAKTYAYSVYGEPYRLTNEEWYADGVNTTPNLKPNPTKLPYHDNLEGVDCAGLVYKAWALTGTRGSTAFTCYKTTDYISSRYNASKFWQGCEGACTIVCGNGQAQSCSTYTMQSMDAYAVLAGTGGYSVNHVGLVYSLNSDGSTKTLEATNCSSSPCRYQYKNINWQSDSAFRGIRRSYWSPSCSACTNGSCPISPPAAP